MTYTANKLADLAIKANQNGRHDVAAWLRSLAPDGADSVTLTAEAVAVINGAPLPR